MYHKTGQKKFCKVGRELDGILEIKTPAGKQKARNHADLRVSGLRENQLMKMKPQSKK